jgi:hypothetical protein
MTLVARHSPLRWGEIKSSCKLSLIFSEKVSIIDEGIDGQYKKGGIYERV